MEGMIKMDVDEGIVKMIREVHKVEKKEEVVKGDKGSKKGKGQESTYSRDKFQILFSIKLYYDYEKWNIHRYLGNKFYLKKKIVKMTCLKLCFLN